MWSFPIIMENITSILKFIMTALLIKVITNQNILKNRLVNIYDDMVGIKDVLENENRMLKKDVTLCVNDTKMTLIDHYDKRARELEEKYTRIITEFSRLLEQRKIDNENHEKFHKQLYKVNKDYTQISIENLKTIIENNLEGFSIKLNILETSLEEIMKGVKDTTKFNIKMDSLLDIHIRLIEAHVRYLKDGGVQNMEKVVSLVDKIKKINAI